MDTHRTALIAVALTAAAVIAGCGDDEAAPGAAAPADTAPATTPGATAAVAELPAEFTGTWEATSRPSDIKDTDDPPAKLVAGKIKWQLEFHSTGGVNNGPSVTLDSDEFGTMSESLLIEGDQLVVGYGPPCDVFDWTVEGDKLTLKPTGSGCPKSSLSSVYSANWTRVD
jgi:hypothetical protein